MAKQARSEFVLNNESFASSVQAVPQDKDVIMVLAYPAIGEELEVPVGQLFADYGWRGFLHGMKQRFGDFLAKGKDMPVKVKEQTAYDLGQAYIDHLTNGGEWKMQGERDTTGEIIRAVSKITGVSIEDLEKAVEADEEQVREWREDLGVKKEIAKARMQKASELAAKAGKKELVIRGLPSKQA